MPGAYALSGGAGRWGPERSGSDASGSTRFGELTVNASKVQVLAAIMFVQRDGGGGNWPQAAMGGAAGIRTAHQGFQINGLHNGRTVDAGWDVCYAHGFDLVIEPITLWSPFSSLLEASGQPGHPKSARAHGQRPSHLVSAVGPG